jgi:hypothetical protein
MATTPEPFLSLGFAGVDWMESYLVHGPGDVQGQPIELDDEFAAFVVKAYQVDTKGNRKVRRAFLSRSKGRSKSGLAAMIACFEALGPCRFDHFAVEGEVSPWGYEYEPGEPVGVPLAYVEVLNVATEEGQAGNTYDAIYYMLNPDTCSPDLLADYGKIDVGITRTNLPGKRGFIEPVTSADSSKDGGKSTFIVADETHLWVLPRLKRLHGIMTRNLLKRKIASGWMLETSTMYGEGEDSVAEGTHAYAKRNQRDRTLLFDHKQASDKWDLHKRGERMKALREAYGPAAEWMNLEAISDSWDDPQVSESEFRRYWLNQPVPTNIISGAVDSTAWHVAQDVGSKIVGPVTFCVDVAEDRSWASIGAAGEGSGGGLHVEVVDYKAGTGWLVKRIVEVASRHVAANVVIQPNSPAGSMIAELDEAGLRIMKVNTVEYAQACGMFYDAVTDGAIRHIGQPELNFAVNGTIKRPSGDAFVWDRRKSSIDISPLTAVTLAAWGHKTHGAVDVSEAVW